MTVVALAALLALGGCGGGDSESGGTYGSGGSQNGSTQSAKSEAASGSSGAGVVSVADNGELGPILVDSKGFTLYDFHKDKGGKSACYGACAEAWPPLTTEGTAQATKGAMSAKLGTTMRKDGTEQVTYAGHPLYTYVVDTKPGDTTGQDVNSFGAQWYALQPSGAEAGD